LGLILPSMSTRLRFRKYLYAWIFTSVLFSALALALQFFHQKYNSPQRICYRLNSQVQNFQISLNENLKRYSEFYLEKYSAKNSGRLKTLQKNDGITFLVFKNNLITDWSTNTIPVSTLYDSSLYSKSILYLNNGWYLSARIVKENSVFIGLQLIKNQYKFENDYLINNFSSALNVPNELSISSLPGKYNIIGTSNEFLFSINFPRSDLYSENVLSIILFLYLAALLVILNLVFTLYSNFTKILRKRWIFLLSFTLDIVIIRIILFYFDIPHIIYHSQLFSPFFYASSSLLPSLGEFLIDALFALFLAGIFYKYSRTRIKFSPLKKWQIYSLQTVLYGLVALLYYWLVTLLLSLVMNSNIVLNFHNILGFSQQGIVSIIVASLLIISFFLLLIRITEIAFILYKSILAHISIITAVSFLFYLLTKFSIQERIIFASFLFLIMAGNFLFTQKIYLYWPSRKATIYFLAIISALCTFSLDNSKNEKEREERKFIAMRLSEDRDQLAEYFFSKIEQNIHTDENLNRLLIKARGDTDTENLIIEYLRNNYFSNYWSKYTLQFTFCSTEKKLSVKPENYIIDCSFYFSQLIDRIGQPTGSPGLYHLKEGFDVTNYLARLSFTSQLDHIPAPLTIYIEISSTNAPQDSGYPELLLDNSQKQSIPNISNYSYAIYSNGELVKNVGAYFYGFNAPKISISQEFHFFTQNGYNHLVHPINQSTLLILSRRNQSLVDVIAPFSYFFIILSVSFILILSLFRSRYKFNVSNLSFKFKLQLALVAIILVATVGIGSITVYYLINININKNKDTLIEKLHTVLIELEDKFGNSSELTPELSDSLQGQLTKYSDAYFTDINIYNTNGILLTSSREAIFSEGLIGPMMNSNAFSQLSRGRRTLFIQNESIGGYQYLSAYIPFRNNDNKLIGYLNLPYFLKQSSLRQEISAFILAFTNIYAILTALAIALALIISNYITRPLKLIRDKLGKVKLGQLNEKIEWHREDEIGGLIAEYNRMIDALAQSADMLARSERESAWREMAKQVAHEIKNPLTPIKLSVQHLQKSWDEHAPDWDDRLKKFTNTLIQQIDTLASIASEFSDFAKMPQTKNIEVELISIIQSAIILFKNTPGIIITFDAPDYPCYAWADEKQLLRVFNNLFRNAVQSIPHAQEGKINVRIGIQKSEYVISIADNGKGIAIKEQDKIFVPNFTTKSGGSGLGLSIVHNIVKQAGGQIWFDSKENKGTTFYVSFPAHTRNN
jgi:two-component system, NtrC family, nitrogen regulation sensor histidine kinase NtrY